MFTSDDYDKFRALRITHVATRFEELIRDEANDDAHPRAVVPHRRRRCPRRTAARTGSTS